eukprot:TRINITY_DN14549_c0_g2_i1.p1 TRINITY_DN14549_c0_g2~~TRINITY_DN14549_c0_g2_i1.p1  ORF type:complete len:400 (+),score=95.93 TRINITY_DN14549_c0_g2_i1:1051-2250(+)
MKKQKAEQEKLAKKLTKEMEDFQKQREAELAEFEETKRQESQRLKKEKRVFERQMRTLHSLPNRKEREEIEQLKREVSQLKEELKSRDSRYKLQMDRAKKQIDDLTTKNSELQTEIKILEGLRVKEMTTTKKAKKLKENVPPVSSTAQYEVQNEVVPIRREPSKVPSTKPQSSLNAAEVQSNAILNQFIPNSQPITPAITEIKPNVNPVLTQTEQAAYDYKDAAPQLSEQDVADLLEDAKYALVFPPQYHSRASKLQSQSVTSDGKAIRFYDDGKTEFVLPNGTKKECYADGYSVTYFPNKDVSQVFPDGRVVDYYHNTNTTQTTLPSGTKVYRLPNGQVEKDYTDGAKEVITPRGTVKCIFTDGGQEIIYTDGSIERIDRYGNKLGSLINNEEELSYS